MLHLLATLTLAVAPQLASASPCAARDAPVLIDTSSRTLVLCEGPREAARYRVNLGAGGVDKRAQGDRKTPLGTYPLAAPRPSNSGFTLFVPIGYPTRTQKARGLTGGAIGIHGPPDYLPSSVVDVAFETPWTDGCVMVRTREEIEEIAEWMRTHAPTRVEIW